MILSIGMLVPEKFAFALLLLFVYSLGLGAVLVLIGALLVKGKTALLARSPRRELILSYLPMLSALIIIGLGSFFCVANFYRHAEALGASWNALSNWFRA